MAHLHIATISGVSITGTDGFGAHSTITANLNTSTSVKPTITFPIVDWTLGSGYDTISSEFTAPVTGYYFFRFDNIDNIVYIEGVLSSECPLKTGFNA